jgi:hypothetical protein
MTRLILLGITLLLSVSLYSHASRATETPTPMPKEGYSKGQLQPVVENETTGVGNLVGDFGRKLQMVYKNTQYGFEFSLPDSWKGYTIVTDKWEGSATGDARTVETGPMLLIRHPQWTTQHQRQDIPIMIFTQTQWNSLQQEKFHIGAAPVGPSELGRNRGYVFALPARYNYAFPTGYEEVEEILKSKPLKSLTIR